MDAEEEEGAFGCRVHIGMDAGSGLIRGVEFTPANVADTEAADALIMGDEEAVHADKAYESKERREHLRSQGVKDRIMHRGHKHQTELRIGSGGGMGCCRRCGRLWSRR